MRKFSQQLTYWLGATAIGLIIGLTIQFVRAWTEPGGAAPTSDIGAPINTGSLPQWKEGNLMINSGWDTDGNGKADTSWPIGLLVPNGNVGIGTDTPNSSKGFGFLSVRDVWLIDAGKWVSELEGGTSGYHVFDPYNIPGPQDFTIPPGVHYINVRVWGAGGGGGGGLGCYSVNDPCGMTMCESGGGGAGGGAYIEAGYIVDPGETYVITAGNEGSGKKTFDIDNMDIYKRVSCCPTIEDGGDGSDTTIVRKSDGDVIFRSGGGKGGKKAKCASSGAGGAGGVAYVTSSESGKINLIKKLDGSNGFKMTLGDDCDGGNSPEGGAGGRMCGAKKGEAPGGGGAGGTPFSICGNYGPINGGNGGYGKVVIFW